MSSSVPTGYVEKGPFEMVPHWVLEHPEISGNAVRLYAVLCRYGNKDRPSWPARHTLAKKMNVSPSTVDRARHELVTIGALCFINRKTDEGDWTSNLYHIHWDQVLDCRYLTGGRGLPYTGDVYAPMGDGPPPAGDGLPPVMNETDLYQPDLSDPDKDGVAQCAPPSANVIAQQITRAYTDRVPLSKFVAIMGIVKKALKAGYAPERIEAALIDLADEGRPVTIDTLRIQLEGISPTPSRRDQRLNQTMAWAAEQDALDGMQEVEA